MNISFAMSIHQIRDESKTVSRRLGWQQLKPGDLLLPVEKCMGLKKDEKIKPIRGPIIVTNVRFEPLQLMTDDPLYGNFECILEGFPDLTAEQFVHMLCRAYRCTPSTTVTRIQFCYS